MTAEKTQTLPYRTSGDELKLFIEAVARNKNAAQIQGLFSASANYQGTLLAAQSLGFIDEDTKLLDRGKEFLLHEAERAGYLLEAMLDYEPYQLVIDAIFARINPKETAIDWIVNWWGTRGYGASQNNREEGAAAFGKLIEYAGLGAYLIGRRGRLSRIEWSPAAHKTLREYAENEIRTHQGLNNTTEQHVLPPSIGSATETSFTVPDLIPVSVDRESLGYSTLSLALSDKRAVQLRVPILLSRAEKDRLLKLIELMVEVEDPQGDSEV
jgi:hypothetical protein